MVRDTGDEPGLFLYDNHIVFQDLLLVLTILIVAIFDQSLLLGMSFDEVGTATLGASFWDRLVPENKITIWILTTTVEHFAALRSSLYYFAAAVWALDSNCFQLYVPALRVTPTSSILAEPSMFDS